MKKVVIVCISLVILFLVGVYSYLKVSQPLVAVQSAYTLDKQVVLVSVGNKNPFGEIEIQEVLVNNMTKPTKVIVQVSNNAKGFILSDDNNSEEARKYTFKELDEVKLQAKTDPQVRNEGIANSEDPIYAVTISHQNSIDNVIIKYRYLGISHEKSILIK